MFFAHREIDLESPTVIEMRGKSTILFKVCIGPKWHICEGSRVSTIIHLLMCGSWIAEMLLSSCGWVWPSCYLQFAIWLTERVQYLTCGYLIDSVLATQNCLQSLKCTVCVAQTTSGVAIGETKDRSKEFVYDHSYWSVEPQDTHYISQEQVIANTGEYSMGKVSWPPHLQSQDVDYEVGRTWASNK